MGNQNNRSVTEGWRSEATVEEAKIHGLSEEEYSLIVKAIGRVPNLVELGMCGALFSEHCSYKSTKAHLRNLPVTGPRVIHGPGENAGVVDIGDGEAVAFKIESHNHPSFIEPFQGAATGVGGILRDVFTMGARPLALMNALRFGDPSNPKTPHLLSRAVGGIGFYGNCMGIPTVGGELFFHEAYNGNCLVNAFALGLVDTDKIFLGNASGVGNPVFYVGSKTGRDGIHGATMASASFDENAEEKRPTVQVGDPFQEKLLLEACLEVMRSGAVVGIQDMGAAGLTSSTFETADRAGTGVRMDLDRVPQRETGMNPYEIMLSESQERMLIIVERGKEQAVIDIFKHWELDVCQIGEVIESTDVELWWHGAKVASLPVKLLTSAVPVYNWKETEPASQRALVDFDPSSLPEPNDLSAVWLKLLASPNLCSREPLYTQYDSTVRMNTVRGPGGDAAVIRVKRAAGDERPEKGVAMTLDCNSFYCAIEPRRGSALSVIEAFRNVTAVGAEAIGISDCLNCGNPQKPEQMWALAETIRGLAEAADKLGIPIVSGNVSLYNETVETPILPTPQIALVGLIDDASLAVGSKFISVNDRIFVIGDSPSTELGGSLYLLAQHGALKGKLPDYDYNREMATAKLVRTLIGERLLVSCHDISSGGLATALAESCFSASSCIGASISTTAKGAPSGILFSEGGPRYLVSCKDKDAERVRSLVEKASATISAEGKTGGDTITVEGLASIPVRAAWAGWRDGLNPLFGFKAVAGEAVHFSPLTQSQGSSHGA